MFHFTTKLSVDVIIVARQHQHEIPNTHVLLTWLDDVKKRYSQLRSWVKSGMVPQEWKTPVVSRVSVGDKSSKKGFGKKKKHAKKRK